MALKETMAAQPAMLIVESERMYNTYVVSFGRPPMQDRPGAIRVRMLISVHCRMAEH